MKKTQKLNISILADKQVKSTKSIKGGAVAIDPIDTGIDYDFLPRPLL